MVYLSALTTTRPRRGIREFLPPLPPAPPNDLPRWSASVMLGDGSTGAFRHYGGNTAGASQTRRHRPGQFLIAESFLSARDEVTLDSMDKCFLRHGDRFSTRFFTPEFRNGATIFGYHVNDPERYGVVEFDSAGKAISIEEKPKQPRSNYHVPGLAYTTTKWWPSLRAAFKPSARGELV